MLASAEVAIVVVAFRNPDDVIACLEALAKAPATPSFAILICENGGAGAYDALIDALMGLGGPCAGESEGAACAGFVRVRRLRLGAALVVVGEAPENLGYGGGINAWMSAIAVDADWRGIWVLNPDTKPEPQALAALVNFARDHGKGMVGSRAMYVDTPNLVRARGLKWRKFAASVRGVDIFAPASIQPAPEDVEARIDAPSGCSFYVTRECLGRIGPMDERYFLYYEDLDWGLRAKASCGVGYAFDSVVPHVGGTTLGTAKRLADFSRLAVYLEFRNRILFVRRHYRGWLTWTVVMAIVQSGRYLLAGAGRNFISAVAGLRAGLNGETGRPDHLLPATAP